MKINVLTLSFTAVNVIITTSVAIKSSYSSFAWRLTRFCSTTATNIIIIIINHNSSFAYGSLANTL